jgi:hypothetical protein
MANPSRMKRDIDKAKKEKAAEKRERRQKGGEPDEAAASAEPTTGSTSNDALLSQLEQIHAQFAAEELDFEEFEKAKDALIAQLAME